MKAEDATTESTTSKVYKDGNSSDNVPWIDEEKCAEGIVPMVRKDQGKGENVDEEWGWTALNFEETGMTPEGECEEQIVFESKA